MGNIDWRPVLNLWAVVQYVTKYATKAPKGSRKLQEVLKDAVDEVCTYVPEGDNADYLRRSIRKFFARTLGERDYHAYEAVQLGLQLPLVIPLMPIVSLNTSGARPLKKREELKTAGDDAPIHYDSRCDKFDKRLEMVKKQRVAGYKEVSEEEIRDVSMYEFYWKYIVYRGRVKPAPSQVCLMVTPSYSADCANVEHHCHNSYARSVVIAFWRHMSKADRDLVNHKSMESGGEKNRPPTFMGGTDFKPPFDGRYLGVYDLYMKFEGKKNSKGEEIGWTLALLEMLVDNVLHKWVPTWLIEQYERANPFFKEVLIAMQSEVFESNRALLLRTKREMIRRHHLHLRRAEEKNKQKKEGDDDLESRGDVDDDASDGDLDGELHAFKEGEEFAKKFLQGDEMDEDPNDDRVELNREPLPGERKSGDAVAQDSWDGRDQEELLSACAGIQKSSDRVVIVDARGAVVDEDREQNFGVLINPRNFDWKKHTTNVDHREKGRLEALAKAWYGKASVGDGADVVLRKDLDPWQKFAHDIVMDPRNSKITDPLRLMLLGTAGTGKSRTIRSFVHSIRNDVRERSGQGLAQARNIARLIAAAIRSGASAASTQGLTTANVATMLGVPSEDVSAYFAAEQAAAVHAQDNTKANKKRQDAYNALEAKFEERVKNSCILAAPTGCASFQLGYGASTLHRVFGIPVGYCGPAKARDGQRFLRMKTRLTQACLFVLDEMSMICLLYTSPSPRDY